MTETLNEIFNLSFTQFMKSGIKINNKKKYYFLLLNKTNNLGITSKNAFISLFDYIYIIK